VRDQKEKEEGKRDDEPTGDAKDIYTVATFDGRADVDIDAEDDEDDDKEENEWRAVYPDGRERSKAESRNSLDAATPLQVSSLRRRRRNRKSDQLFLER